MDHRREDLPPVDVAWKVRAVGRDGPKRRPVILDDNRTVDVCPTVSVEFAKESITPGKKRSVLVFRSKPEIAQVACSHLLTVDVGRAKRACGHSHDPPVHSRDQHLDVRPGNLSCPQVTGLTQKGDLHPASHRRLLQESPQLGVVRRASEIEARPQTSLSGVMHSLPSFRASRVRGANM